MRALPPSTPSVSESGSALVYILIAIALLAILTVTFMEPSSQQTSSQNTFKTVETIDNQASVIRSAIQECILSYPKGDPAIVTTGGSATDPGARKNYPINPESDYYGSDKASDRQVRHLRCPGDNPGGANQADHAYIFSGDSGKFLPPPPDLFSEWQYYNGTDGIFFWTSTDKSDAYLMAALKKVDAKYSQCEADIIDATSGAQDLDSESTVQCPGGSVCFRSWIITRATAVYQPGSPEASGTPPACP